MSPYMEINNIQFYRRGFFYLRNELRNKAFTEQGYKKVLKARKS